MMEFTESVTGVQHAAPGEVLVFQIDERSINNRARRKARGANAESVGATDRIWQPFNFLERPFREIERSEIQITPGCATLGRFLGEFLGRFISQ